MKRLVTGLAGVGLMLPLAPPAHPSGLRREQHHLTQHLRAGRLLLT
jgi:hypothetical protein